MPQGVIREPDRPPPQNSLVKQIRVARRRRLAAGRYPAPRRHDSPVGKGAFEPSIPLKAARRTPGGARFIHRANGGFGNRLKQRSGHILRALLIQFAQSQAFPPTSVRLFFGQFTNDKIQRIFRPRGVVLFTALSTVSVDGYVVVCPYHAPLTRDVEDLLAEGAGLSAADLARAARVGSTSPTKPSGAGSEVRTGDRAAVTAAPSSPVRSMAPGRDGGPAEPYRRRWLHAGGTGALSGCFPAIRLSQQKRFLRARDQRFESISLHRRVRELSVPPETSGATRSLLTASNCQVFRRWTGWR